ncbi:aspartyl-phosphate phosphatase Spo0E family protein [Xylanibacillus composti]|uniref:Aspartyl-phosphate phosphatase Spo0E family protein n=1 Tax=Xylanibacillus composti TaxID=1572762 RepID=A0A8J4H2W6_9BACL|nr:aspartyl-phosphate phosphatase Spo0E family protein [Xylanibacillus composti]MDT9725625.1 aspartyl-phosphate phosphatase Spo0E family protein [Xylanibacillus composti]GIQ67718.1 hypothetical protein XYCOK13_05420 [Xylanibacillus composti]
MRPSYATRNSKALKEEIESLRQELVRSVHTNGSFVHEQVLHISQQLDKLIFELQRHKQKKTN